jgi:hypothetical protein
MFIENVGQWAPSTSSGQAARYQVWGSPLGVGTTWLAEDAIWVTVVKRGEVGTLERSNVSTFQRSNVETPERQRVNLRISFPGANPNVRIEPFDPVDTTISYFLGNDPDGWHADVPVYGGVRYVDLYPGVDLILGASDRFWQVETQAVAEARVVDLRIEGAEGVTLDGDNLRLATAVGDLGLTRPSSELALQVEVANAEAAPAIFELTPSSPPASARAPLDNPTDLLYSTFLGGGSGDSGWDIAVDGAGSVYVTGYTMSNDFPTLPGTFDPHSNGLSDAFVVKLDPDGSNLTYATFLGGSDDDDGYGIAVDGVGSTYVTGRTWSSDFPTTPGAFDTSRNGINDPFVAKLNPAGTDLVYATFLGGNYWDWGRDIAVDELANAYVTGWTYSSDFPTTTGAFDTSFNGGNCGPRPCPDAFVAMLNPVGTDLVYATFLGGSYSDYGHAITLDGAGSAYVTGYTRSSDFPTTPGAFDTSQGGWSDAFVAKLNSTGTGLAYATFLGGGGADYGNAIAVDGVGSAYVTGQTDSRNFPTTPDAFDTSRDGVTDAFVAKVNPDGTDLVYATYLGGSGDDGRGYFGGGGIVLDAVGSAHVTGGTSSSDFPITPGAFDTSLGGSRDAFVAKVNPGGSDLVYATYLGNSSDDEGYTIALDRVGEAYVAGQTSSSDFPTTPGAFDTSYNGLGDAFVAKLDMPAPPTAVTLVSMQAASGPNVAIPAWLVAVAFVLFMSVGATVRQHQRRS